MKEGLTFDDVLLVPKRSKVDSRKDVDLRFEIFPGIVLNLPIISAAMDTVTESAMAIEMARNGGLGVIHRFCAIDYQVEEVKKVKRAENYLIEEPVCVFPETKLKEIYELQEKFQFQTFLVVDENKKLLGLISKRDYHLEDDLEKRAKELMTPIEKLIVVKNKISFDEAKEIFKKYKIEKIPIVDEENKVRGLITFRDFQHSLNKKAVRDQKGRLLVAAAIGIRGDYLERAEALVEAGCDILVIDVAHGHLEKCLKAVREVKNKFPNIPLIAGNIATKEGAEDLKNAGADIIKVGIGPGSACSTRIVAGAGVPQLTAIMMAKEGAGEKPIIADGGIRTFGDIVKALAAGASAVMLGSMLAGTDEAPGKLMYLNGKKVKTFRGMASRAAYEDKKQKLKEDKETITSEGADFGFVDYKGPVKEILNNLEAGIRSGFSYCGALNLKELWQNAEFIKITDAGRKESGFHNINIV